LSGFHLAAGQGVTTPDPVLQQELAASQAVLDEFLSTDIVVLTISLFPASSTPGSIAFS
jgi:hypothetical protein